MGRCIRKTLSAIAATGTLAVAGPPAPSAWRRTCQEPGAISQSEPVKKFASIAERCMASGVGGYLEAAPVSGTGVTLSWRMTGPRVRTSTMAMPGTTVGGRIVTKNLYGPAVSCSKTSLEPTCAWAGMAAKVRRSKRCWSLDHPADWSREDTGGSPLRAARSGRENALPTEIALTAALSASSGQNLTRSR